MRRLVCLFTLLPLLLWAKDFELKLALDPLLDPTALWKMDAAALGTTFASEGFKENPFFILDERSRTATFSTQPYSNIRVDLSIADAQLDRAEVRFDAASGRVSQLLLTTTKSTAALKARAEALTKVASVPGPRPVLGWKQDASIQCEVWEGLQTKVVQLRGATQSHLLMLPAGDDVAAAVSALTFPIEVRSDTIELFVRLDDVLPVPDLWTLSPSGLEARLTMPDTGLKENPFYRWSTTSKESARISRDIFSNVKLDLLLFGDAVHAEEANIEFKAERASKLSVTLLTRGNSGAVSATEFDRVFKATGRALGEHLGVRPTVTTMAGRQLVKTQAYLWTTPHTLALLEHNDEAPKGKVEFLRLTLVPASARKELLNLAGLGGQATTRARAALPQSVKRDAKSGAVEIAGIPMRDQGQKGYCVAASCERLFRYLGQPTDMDEIAQVVGTDAERGTSPSIMYAQLKRIDERYNMRVKLMSIPRGYGLGRDVRISETEIERAQKASLMKVAQASVDAGLPLLWCVVLPLGQNGLPPADGEMPPRAPGGPPTSGVGHMRMIIGYNAKAQTLIYTDSWGAGHERKEMPLAEAEAMSTAVFAMLPNR